MGRMPNQYWIICATDSATAADATNPVPYCSHGRRRDHAKNAARKMANNGRPSVNPLWPTLPPNCQSDQLASRYVSRTRIAAEGHTSERHHPAALNSPPTASNKTGDQKKSPFWVLSRTPPIRGEPKLKPRPTSR